MSDSKNSVIEQIQARHDSLKYVLKKITAIEEPVHRNWVLQELKALIPTLTLDEGKGPEDDEEATGANSRPGSSASVPTGSSSGSE